MLVHLVECPNISTTNHNCVYSNWGCTSIYRLLSYPFRSLETWQDIQRKEKLVVGVVRWNILVARILYEIKKNSLSIYLYNTFIHNLFSAHMSHVLINRGMHRYLIGAVYVLKG